jgi:hypothetical protein
MGGGCGIHGGDENAYESLLRKSYHVQHAAVDGRIILTFIGHVLQLMCSLAD